MSPAAVLLAAWLALAGRASATRMGRNPVNYTQEAEDIRACAASSALPLTVVLVGESSEDRVSVSRGIVCFLKIVQVMADEGDDDDDDAPEEGMEIPLPKVDRESLSLIVEFASGKAREAGPGLERLRFSEVPRPLPGPLSETASVLKDDAAFMDEVAVDLERLFRLTNAANFVDFPALLELCAASIAQMFIGKTPQQIREAIPSSLLRGEPQAEA